MQFVGAGLSPVDDLYLRQSSGITEPVASTLLVGGEDIGAVGLVQAFVLAGIHGACGAVEGDGSACFIEEGGLAEVFLLGIEGHDIAGSSDPEGRTWSGEVREVLDAQHLFM